MTVEQRNDHRVFAGSDTAHTAKASSGLTKATLALTPLMLAAEGGLLVAWDGAAAGTAVAVLALAHDGIAPLLTYYKSGTFAIEVSASRVIVTLLRAPPLAVVASPCSRNNQ